MPEPCLDEHALRALAEGGAADGSASAHASGCASCRARLEAWRSAPAGVPDSLDANTMPLAGGGLVPRPRVAPPPPPELGRGTAVGRYTVLELVGSGGMGEVYAAYDPHLDRKIALKLLRQDARGHVPEAEVRLLREAKAIARVSHPNVVTVHDAGTYGDRIFVAMEFVDGGTLKDWLAAAPRARGEILETFGAAARGLAAAHAAGLVHRDFKPLNVMVGRDGAVRVTDFGLVRQVGDQGDAALGGTPLGDEVDLTRTGDLVGTPRYMSPEQFDAAPVDARSDQFSFCVALYEALYGQPPFAGDTLAPLMANVLAGNVSPPPAKSTVPSWLRRVVLRGLEVDPARRFPSMQALGAALEANRGTRRRRAWLGGLLLAATALGALAARHFGAAKPTYCRGGAARWQDVWAAGGAPSPQKDAIHAAFLASGKSYAERAFAETARALDGYVRRWVEMYTDACEATQVRGEQSAAVLDLRMSCLQERSGHARALVDVLSHADGRVVENASSAAAGLPSLDRCADVPLLRAVVRPPEDEASRRRVEALRAEVARVTALHSAGRCQDAEQLARDLIPRVKAVGYAPLVAETLTAAAMNVDTCLEPATAFARFDEAFRLALASRHDEIAADAALFMAGNLADRSHDTVAGRHWLEVGQALVARIGRPRLLNVWSLVSEGVVLLYEKRGPEAVAVEERVIHEKEAILGPDDPDLAISYNTYGCTLHLVGRDADALAAFARGTAIVEGRFGREHPVIGMLLENRAEVLAAMHRDADALAAFEETVAIWRRSDSSPIMIAVGLRGAGEALIALGRYAEAVPPLNEALAAQRAEHVPPAEIGATRFALARALGGSGTAPARAVDLARAARRELEAGPPGDERSQALASVDAWLGAHSSLRK